MNNHTPIRGDIYKFDFGQNPGSVQCGIRPAVVIQNNNLSAHSPVVIVAPVSSVQKKQSMPAHVFLGQRFGLILESQVLLEQIRTVPQSQLGKYIGHIDDEAIMHLIDDGLCKTLGISSDALMTNSSNLEEVPYEKK